MIFKICYTEECKETGKRNYFRKDLTDDEICEELARLWSKEYQLEDADKTCVAEIEGMEI